MAEEETTEEKTEAPAEKKSGSMLLIIIIVVLILLILVGAVVAILMMGGDDSSQQSSQNVQQNQPKQRMQQQNQSQGRANLQSATPFVEIGTMFPLDTFTVNLLSDSGKRYLKVEMNLELGSEELGAELDSKTPVIRDTIIRLLSSKSLEEISTAKGKGKLKQQIVDQLNMRLRDGQINNVYFTEFVVQ